MDFGTLVLMLAIVTLTVAYTLQPLFARRDPKPDELIAHWIKELSRENRDQISDEVCSNCGQAISNTDRFCPSCGTKLGDD